MMEGLSIIENFITHEEEEAILAHIPENTPRTTEGRNTILRWGTNIGYKNGIVSPIIPEWLAFPAAKMINLGYLDKMPDSVTVNEYFPWQSIDFHVDTQEAGPIVSIISLLGDAKMTLRRNSQTETVDIPARSLVQLRDEARNEWEHSVHSVISNRYSIVYR